MFPITDEASERIAAQLDILPCKGGGGSVYQCGYGDCSVNFTDNSAWNIILRVDQKSNATSLPTSSSSPCPVLPPKTVSASSAPSALAVGLGIGIPLFVLLLVSIWVIFYQQQRLKRAWVPRRSTDRPPDWQWPHKNYSISTSQGPRPTPPGSTYSSPLHYTSPTGFGPRQPSNPPGSELRPPLQELRDGSSEALELDGYSRPRSQPVQFI